MTTETIRQISRTLAALVGTESFEGQDGTGSFQAPVSLIAGKALLGAPWTVPLVADFTALNLSTVVLTDSPAGINIWHPSGTSFQVHGAYKAPPAAPYSVYLRMDKEFIVNADNCRWGILLGNSVSGQYEQFGWFSNAGGGAGFAYNRWNSITSYNANGTVFMNSSTNISNWLRLDVTATGATLYAGNGYNWYDTGCGDTFAAFLKNGAGAVDQVGFAVQFGTAQIKLNSFSFTAPAAGGGGIP